MIPTVPSRPDSRSSNSSVNTLEDLSLAFNQTIALGEETLGIESDGGDVEGIPKCRLDLPACGVYTNVYNCCGAQGLRLK